MTDEQRYSDLILEIHEYYQSVKHPIFTLSSYVRLRAIMYKSIPPSNYFHKIEILEHMLYSDLPRLKQQRRKETIDNIFK